MKNNHHFLDTNIILSMVLDNNECFKDAKNYLEFNSIHYISNSAKKEAKFKINNDKRIFLDIIEFIKNFAITNHIVYTKLNKFLENAKKSFLMQYDGMDFPENMPKKRFQNLVKSFFITFEHEINKILIDEDDLLFKNFILETNLITLSNLEAFLSNYKCISFIDSGKFISNLKNIGLSNKDAMLVDESCYLSITLNNSVNFITFDKGILKFKNQIYKSLLQSVIVSSPMEFVSVNN